MILNSIYAAVRTAPVFLLLLDRHGPGLVIPGYPGSEVFADEAERQHGPVRPNERLHVRVVGVDEDIRQDTSAPETGDDGLRFSR